MSIKTKTQIEQDLLDAERIKVIVDSGELATDTEVVLVSDSEEVAAEQGPITKTSEELVSNYLGEMSLSHDEPQETQESGFDPAKAAIPMEDMTLTSLSEPLAPAPSETPERPFLSADSSQTTANTKPVQGAYYGADPSFSLMG